MSVLFPAGLILMGRTGECEADEKSDDAQAVWLRLCPSGSLSSQPSTLPRSSVWSLARV